MKESGRNRRTVLAGLVCGAVVLMASLVFTVAARADEALAYIPDGMMMVGCVDVHTLYSHEQMAGLRNLIEEGMDGKEEAEDFKAMKVSFENVKRFVFGVKMEDGIGMPPFTAVVEMKEEIDWKKLAAKMIDDGFEQRYVSLQAVYTTPGGGPDIVFLSPTRILITSGELTEGVLSRANPVTGNAAMMAAADLPARKETIWVVAVPSEDLLAEFGGGVPPFVMDLEGVLQTVNVGKMLDIQMVATFTNEESAAAMMGLMQMTIPAVMMQAADFGIEQMPEVTVEGRAAKLTASIPVETLSAFISGPLLRARENARMTSDLNTLKQIGAARFQYENDKREIPGSLDALVEAGYIDSEALFISDRLKGKVPPPHFALSPHYSMRARSNEIIAWIIPHESVEGGGVLFMDNSVRYVRCTPEEYAKLIENLINRTNANDVTRHLPGANTRGFE